MVEVRDDLRKHLLRLLVQIANSDAGSENSIIGVLDSHVRRRLRSLSSTRQHSPPTARGFRVTNKVIQLNGRHALVHAGNDLLGDGSGIDVIRVEAVT